MSEQKLGRYRLLSLLATGGMGEVFLARQEGPAGFSKTVVVKRILRHLAQDQGFIDLFLNEARLAAQLQHPNIAQVFGLEQEGGTWFIAMEHVHGKSLRAIIDQARKRELRIPTRLAARLASQALQALHFAHVLKDERGKPLGILHRDVTPENILVAYSGVVKLVDFGIAKAIGAETRVGRPKGKLAYMAPEQVKSGAPIDRHADIYAVGVVLYEALLNRRPPNVPTSLTQLGEPRQPYAHTRELPEALDAIVAKALADDPKDRFDTAHEMAEALEGYLASTGQSALPADMAAFLRELYGASADMNPLVAADLPVTHTGQFTVMGTAPLGTAPLAAPPSASPGPPAKPGPSPAAGPGAPSTGERQMSRQQALVALVFGGGTGAVFLLISIMAIVGSSTPAVPVSEPQPTDMVLPAMSLTPRGPGSKAGVVDKPSRVRPPSRKVKRQRTGKVTLRVKPWAEVVYGGKALGTTPIDPVTVPAGTATFVLRNKKLGVTRKVSVKVPAGGTVVLKADLLKK